MIGSPQRFNSVFGIDSMSMSRDDHIYVISTETYNLTGQSLLTVEGFLSSKNGSFF